MFFVSAYVSKILVKKLSNKVHKHCVALGIHMSAICDENVLTDLIVVADILRIFEVKGLIDEGNVGNVFLSRAVILEELIVLIPCASENVLFSLVFY